MSKSIVIKEDIIDESDIEVADNPEQPEKPAKPARKKSSVLHVPTIYTGGYFMFPVRNQDGSPINTTYTVTSPLVAAQFTRHTPGRGNKDRHLIAFIPNRIPNLDSETEAKLDNVGTIAQVRLGASINQEDVQIINQVCRCKILQQSNGMATVEPYYTATSPSDNPANRMICDRILALLKDFAIDFPNFHGLLQDACEYSDAGLLSDFLASQLLLLNEHKAQILLEFDPIARAEKLFDMLCEELAIFRIEDGIEQKVQARINKSQKEYYLKEHMHAIEEELGITDDNYKQKILDAKLPEEIEKKLLNDASKLQRLPTGSPDQAMLGSYLDTVLALPWNKASEEKLDLSKAKKILDRDHDGMEKVKERILEYLAVKKRTNGIGNQILCLVGPPGVGKTSVISSIATAMGRKCVRVSLGGIRDEADIRGHRKTYIGAMPGRIMEGISRAGVSNPVMLLDELDKMTRDAHGDPGSAMLEVLDGEQNKNFRDHFIEVPFDLSDVIFIATANTLDTVPRPLIDRMEIIELHTYTRTEKMQIAKHHLIGKQFKRHGITSKELTITDKALLSIIDDYTRESGVRNLERSIATIARKTAKYLAEHPDETGVKVTPKELPTFLGTQKMIPTKISAENEVGVVNGLAYTEVGGDVLKVEVAIMEGSGKLELTGSLGDVMKESAQLAVSYVRTIAKDFNIPTDFYKTKDIHIHFPEGATPKDGPSAGVTIVTALVSALTDRPVLRDIAMTGEVTLRGKVLAIGGLREKTMGAYIAGVKRVFVPKENEQDLNEIDKEAKAHLDFLTVSNVREILDAVLC